MKTIKLSISAAVVATIAFTAVNAFADVGFPPPGSITRTITITNNTSNTLGWKYNKDGDACSASPSSGNVATQAKTTVTVNCPWTAKGEFDFPSIGSVYAGYGPCRVISGNISANGDGESCQITVQ